MNPSTSSSLNRLATQATTHCMVGCGIGEVLGLISRGRGHAVVHVHPPAGSSEAHDGAFPHRVHDG